MVYAVFVVMLVIAGLLLLFGGAAAEGAAEGLKLFAGEVLPCLFPFMVCGKYLISAGAFSGGSCSRGKRIAEGVLQCFVCAVCGTPSAALICSAKHERIGVGRASMLCAALNQMNPAFVTGLLAGRLLGEPRYGLPLAIAHYIPAFAAAVLINGIGTERSFELSPAVIDKSSTKDASGMFARAISEACTGVLQIGGTIVFFRVIISVCFESGLLNGVSPGTGAVAAGLFEMTNGLAMLCGAVPQGAVRVCLCAALLSFGGVCVFVQSKLFFPKLSAPWYFLIKLFESAAAYGLCCLLLPLFAGDVSAAVNGSDTLCGVGAAGRAGKLAALIACAAAACAASCLYARIMIKRPALQ